MVKRTPAALLLACGLALGACGEGEPVQSGAPGPTTTLIPVSYTEPVFNPATTPPDQRTYVATLVEGHALADGSELILTLTADRIGIDGGCNGIGGTYRVEGGDVLVADELQSTLVACAEPLMQQDEFLIALLEGRPSMVIEGETVTIADETVTIVFTDQEVADADRPLEGTTWVVEQTRDVMVAGRDVPDGASLVFSGGTIAVRTGCNQGSAFYELGDGTFMMGGPVILTEQACSEELTALEQAIVATLANEVTYEIAADELRLIGHSTELVLRAAGPVDPDPWHGRTFIATAIDGYVLAEGTELRLTFEGYLLRAGGGCNSLSAAFRIEQEVLVVDSVVQTAIGCDAALHAQDEWIAAFLQSRPAVVLEGPTLTMTGGSATIVFTDREVADPDRPLEGTVWNVEGVIDGMTLSASFPPPAASLVFEAGTVRLHSGCNQGTAPYDTVDGALVIQAIELSDSPCNAEEAAIEAAMLAALEGTVTYEITADAMQLGNGDAGLKLRAAS